MHTPEPTNAAAAIDEWLEGYLPRGISERLWFEQVGPLVVPLIRELRLPGVPAAARYARRLSGLAAWGHGEGLPMDREILLDPAVVERHVTSWPFTEKSRATARADLRLMGRKLTKKAP